MPDTLGPIPDAAPTSDFSPIAGRYDATRHVPADRLDACYARLTERGLFPAAGTVLDAGCGTGQISLPLAARGYRVWGFDVSAAMVARAAAKGPGLPARYAVADIRALPVADRSFDAVVVSKLFMHVADWQGACRELIRAARPGAPLVHIRDRDAYGTRLRRHFTARVRASGHARLFLGPEPHADTAVADFLAARGCAATALDMRDLGWRLDVAPRETLRGLEERLFAEFWYVPEADYARALAETAAWARAQPGGLDRAETMTPWLSVEVFRTPG